MNKNPIFRSKGKKSFFALVVIGAICGLPLLPSIAMAHEFWIAPHNYHLQIGQKIIADIQIGEDFQGDNYYYNPSEFDRFEVLQNNKLTKVPGELGNRPAMEMTLEGEGLGVIIHQSDLDSIIYQKFAKFESFAKKEGQPQAITQHRVRGLPRTHIKEIYRRFAKSYIAVGSASGSDKAVGMELEWVAQTNPYDTKSDTLSFQLLYKGAVQNDTQVRVLHKLGTSDAPIVETFLMQTDANGLVQIPNTSGEYLINAVLIVEPNLADAQETRAYWYSLWASATYTVP